jgi:hypothetical protein
MKTATAVKTKAGANTTVITKEVDKVVLITLATVAIGFGIFAFASFAGAAATVGLPAMFKGWVMAVGLV